MIVSSVYVSIIVSKVIVTLVKQSVCPSVLSTKIARSQDLGVRATLKLKESAEIVVKLASLCFESFGKAHERRKLCFVGHDYQLHPHVPLLMRTT
jgi:hypothetical protein